MGDGFVDVFCASDLTGRSVLGGWNDAFAASLEAMDFKPAKPDAFTAQLAGSALGPLHIARLTCGQTALERIQDTGGRRRRQEIGSE